VPSLAAFPAMLKRDRQRLGLRECRAAWLIGLTVRQYRQLEAGEDAFIVPEVWERMVEVFGWPGTPKAAENRRGLLDELPKRGSVREPRYTSSAP
jgi:hypothetical protein